MATEYIRVKNGDEMVLVSCDLVQASAGISVCMHPEDGLSYEPTAMQTADVRHDTKRLVECICVEAWGAIYDTQEQYDATPEDERMSDYCLWSDISYDTISHDEPPTFREIVSPAEGGNYKELVTEGNRFFRNAETRKWLDMPADEIAVWAEWIEEVHDAEVAAMARLDAEEHGLWSHLLPEIGELEWDDQPKLMLALVDALDDLMADVILGAKLWPFAPKIRSEVSWIELTVEGDPDAIGEDEIVLQLVDPERLAGIGSLEGPLLKQLESSIYSGAFC